MPDFQKTIEACSKLLSGRIIDAGASLSVNNPLLSVFLGEGAQQHEDDVKNAYQDCWGNAVSDLRFLNSGVFSQQTVTELSGEMFANHNQFHDRRKIRIAWYWDIMSDDFDKHFDIVCMPREFPTGIELAEYYFIFCRQFNSPDSAKTESRLQKLIEWAEINRKCLIIQSNLTHAGLLDENNIKQSYRGAANVIMIINSGSNTRIARQLAFRLSNRTVWSIGTHTMYKNAREIVKVSLLQILNEYFNAYVGERFDATDVRTRLCGQGKDYNDLFQRLIESEGILPPMPNCFAYLPYTQEMENLYKSLEGSCISRLLGRAASNKIDQRKLDTAIASIKDVWSCLLNKYYRTAIDMRFKSPKGEKTQIQQWLLRLLSQKFNFREMQTLFPQEIDKLRQPAEWNISTDNTGLSVDQRLHSRACMEVKREFFAKMTTELISVMEVLSSASEGFEEILNAARERLRIASLDDSVLRAYTNHVHDIVNDNPDLICHIYPCKNMGELLVQLEKVFTLLVNKSPVYRYSFHEELRFRMNAVGGEAQAADMVNDFFSYNMNGSGGLRLYTDPDGENYSLLNQPESLFGSSVIPRAAGNLFEIPGKDYIERLYIYPVDKNLIMY